MSTSTARIQRAECRQAARASATVTHIHIPKCRAQRDSTSLTQISSSSHASSFVPGLICRAAAAACIVARSPC
eukprot:90137-Pleurochrysis_carterae.AAC.2